MSAHSVLYNIIKDLKFEENVNSIVPPIFFFIFSHWQLHKFSQVLIDRRYGKNLAIWKQVLFVLFLHLQVFCCWFVIIHVFRYVTRISYENITSCEIKYTIRSLMNILYIVVACIPMGLTVIEYMDKLIDHRCTRIFVEYLIPTELGLEAMILNTPHRQIEDINRPLAYKLKRSISSFMVREFNNANTMRNSKTVLDLGKVSKIEDLIKE